VKLRGWQCPSVGPRRGTLVYLHGIADNRESGTGVIERFQERGFDLVAYDSRAHGESEGEFCTYGVLESQDLRRVLDTVAPGPIVLLGTSLGAAVALQGAAQDRRVTAVIAAEAFSDLRTVAIERAPILFTPRMIDQAFRLVERRWGFEVDAASPVEKAREIQIPVLLIHGETDTETPPDHSQRVLAALGGPKRLILVPGAGHNQSLSGDVWMQIVGWLDAVLGSGPV